MANLPLLATASTVVLYYTAYSTAVLLALNVVLYMLALAKVPKTAFAARCLAAYFCLVACALYGVVASVALRLVGREQIAQWTVARAFKHSMRSATGVTFDVQDPAGHLSRTRPAVFVGNHQTELDVLVLGCMFPKYCSVTAKSSLRHVPVLGWFMSLSGTVFIDRKNTKDARQAMAGAADTMQTRRQSVFMFPEGTRSYSKEPVLLPFKKGAFHLAVQAKVPIVPIVVANYSHILWVKGMVFRPGTVPVKVLEPIETKDLAAADVDELTNKVRELMLRELVALSAEARGGAVQVPVELLKNGAAKASGIEAKASPSARNSSAVTAEL